MRRAVAARFTTWRVPRPTTLSPVIRLSGHNPNQEAKWLSVFQRPIWGQAAEVKFVFVYRSVCDRIAFARWKSSNRTAHLPSRENGRASCFLVWGDTFSESGLRS